MNGFAWTCFDTEAKENSEITYYVKGRMRENSMI